MAHEHPGEQAIFEAARKLDDDATRTAYIAEACGDDAVLRERVSNLLRQKDDPTRNDRIVREFSRAMSLLLAGMKPVSTLPN